MSVSQQSHTNTIKKALLVKQMLDEHYEAGNQSKMMAGILRTKISKVYPMSYRTLLRYLKIAKTQTEKSSTQLTLF